MATQMRPGEEMDDEPRRGAAVALATAKTMVVATEVATTAAVGTAAAADINHEAFTKKTFLQILSSPLSKTLTSQTTVIP